MEHLLVIALGALAVVAAPLVPGVRPLAKSAVKGGMALGSAAAAAAVVAGQQWDHLADKVGPKKSEGDLPIIEDTAAAIAEPVQATSAPTGESAEAKVDEAAGAAVELAEDAAADGARDVVDKVAVEAGGAEVPVPLTGDDLTKISGIGAKAAAILADAGITTYAQLAAATDAGLREILESAGSRFRLLDPSTWPDQAGKLLAERSNS